MAIEFPSTDDDAGVISSINTTPLVDVMLVLLIIFLITIPVVTQTVAVSLPKETNRPRQTRPDNIEISVDREGVVYWNAQRLADAATLTARLEQLGESQPQPEVHVRGDETTRYEAVGRVVLACQQAGIQKVSFVTQPPARN
jgi:biopolymer transport protein ExbD